MFFANDFDTLNFCGRVGIFYMCEFLHPPPRPPPPCLSPTPRVL